MDPLSLLFAALLALQGASAQPSTVDATRAVIIDTGSPTATEPTPEPDEARSQIIDTGDH
jgi:hypothetical protein